jgi:hypothetical protein
MATFTKDYKEATANTPILSSAWNDNIYATQERFQYHDHAEGGDNGPQIGRSGLKAEVTDVLDSVAEYEGKIADLETQVTELSKPAIISLSANTAAVGTTIFIKGINFVDPVTVTFGTVSVPNGDIELQTNTTIKAKVPAGGDGNVTVKTTFGTSVSAEFFSTI